MVIRLIRETTQTGDPTGLAVHDDVGPGPGALAGVEPFLLGHPAAPVRLQLSSVAAQSALQPGGLRGLLEHQHGDPVRVAEVTGADALDDEHVSRWHRDGLDVLLGDPVVAPVGTGPALSQWLDDAGS